MDIALGPCESSHVAKFVVIKHRGQITAAYLYAFQFVVMLQPLPPQV